MKKNINQKLINIIEYYNLINANLLLNESPIIRKTSNSVPTFSGNKLKKLESLKKSINSIKNCELKKMQKI